MTSGCAVTSLHSLYVESKKLKLLIHSAARPSQSRPPRESFLQPVAGEAPVAGDGSGTAAHFPSYLLARQAFEDPQFHHLPKRRIDGGEPVQNIIDLEQRVLWGRMRP